MSALRALLILGVLAMSASAGVNRWTIIGPPANVETMAVDPHNPQVLYAAWNGVVARSEDHGATWTSTPVLDLIWPSAIRVSVSIPSTVYVLGNTDVYQSTTAGASWIKRKAPASVGFPMDLQVDARNANVVVVSCWNFCFFGCSGGGVYRSQNGGESWKRIGLNDKNVTSVALDPASLQILYAIADGKLYKTSNGGESWSEISPASGAMQTVAVDAVIPTTIYASAESAGLFRSSDAGRSWELIRTSTFGGSVVAAAFGSRAVFTTAGGWALSFDGGRTWHSLLSVNDSGLQLRNLSQILVSPEACYQVADIAAEDGHILSYELQFPRRRAVR